MKKIAYGFAGVALASLNSVNAAITTDPVDDKLIGRNEDLDA